LIARLAVEVPGPFVGEENTKAALLAADRIPGWMVQSAVVRDYRALETGRRPDQV
jgi:hypothetical protein